MEPSSAPWRAIESPAEAPDVVPSARRIPWVAVGTGAASLLVALAVLFLVSRPAAVVGVDGAADLGMALEAPSGRAAVARASPGGELVVEVAGAVRHPGVYRLPTGARISEAIAAAGGFGPRVDLDLADRRLNLAQPVRDGEEIRVPAIGEPDSGVAALDPAAPASAAAGPVDVNTATADQLDTLPGIGPATAAKIVAAREQQRFATLDELVARNVIGAALLARIQPLATAAP